MTPTPGRLEQIWIKRFKGGPMDSVDAATLIEGQGLENNADLRLRRQVTILEREEWERVTAAAGVSAAAAQRRANFLVTGFPLARSTHRMLRVGDCLIKIHGETKPCHQMDSVANGLRLIMWASWAGGAYGEVIRGGPVAVGDAVAWVNDSIPGETLSPADS